MLRRSRIEEGFFFIFYNLSTLSLCLQPPAPPNTNCVKDETGRLDINLGCKRGRSEGRKEGNNTRYRSRGQARKNISLERNGDGRGYHVSSERKNRQVGWVWYDNFAMWQFLKLELHACDHELAKHQHVFSPWYSLSHFNHHFVAKSHTRAPKQCNALQADNGAVVGSAAFSLAYN